MKTLGVAIATFNGLKYLPAQLDSIVNQTRKPAVISISDDGSTDGTIDYLKAFAERSSIPVVLNVNSRNAGVIENFMLAFEKCDTDYISYCDQDDVWHPERLARIADIIEKTGAALVFHRSEIVDGNLQPRGSRHPDNIHNGTYAFPYFPDYLWGYGHQMVFSRQAFAAMTRITRSTVRSVADCGGCFDGSLLFAAGMVGDICFVEDELVKFRRHDRATSPAGVKTASRETRRHQVERYCGLIDGLIEESQTGEPRYLQHLQRLKKTYASRRIIYASRSRARRIGAFASLLMARSYGSIFKNKLPMRHLLVDGWHTVKGASAADPAAALSNAN
jgi:glycosyltransferase involved in cell wall biosynthesis